MLYIIAVGKGSNPSCAPAIETNVRVTADGLYAELDAARRRARGTTSSAKARTVEPTDSPGARWGRMVMLAISGRSAYRMLLAGSLHAADQDRVLEDLGRHQGRRFVDALEIPFRRDRAQARDRPENCIGVRQGRNDETSDSDRPYGGGRRSPHHSRRAAHPGSPAQQSSFAQYRSTPPHSKARLVRNASGRAAHADYRRLPRRTHRQRDGLHRQHEGTGQ